MNNKEQKIAILNFFIGAKIAKIWEAAGNP
jgi:hypothetical protein